MGTASYTFVLVLIIVRHFQTETITVCKCQCGAVFRVLFCFVMLKKYLDGGFQPYDKAFCRIQNATQISAIFHILLYHI